MFKGTPPLLLIPALLPLTACTGAAPAERAERTDSAGVIVVTNTGVDRPLAWRFESEHAFGGEEFYEAGPWSVDTDAQGTIHVLDRDGRRVLRYRADGTLLGTVGGPGEGPGELQWPSTLEVTPDGRIRVSDFGRGRVITWSADGMLLDEEQGVDPGTLVRHLSAGEVREVDEWGREASASRLIFITGQDTAEVAVVTWTGRQIELESCGMRFAGMPPIFTPSLRWSAAGDRVAIAAGAAYDIQVLDLGEPRLRVRRRLPPPEATEELAVAEIGDGMRVTTSGGERVCDPAEVVEQRGLAAVAPVIDRVVVEPDGRVWVRRFVAGDESGAIDLFRADGEYLGTLPPGTPLPIGFLPDGRALVVETDEMDVQRLAVGFYVEDAAF